MSARKTQAMVHSKRFQLILAAVVLLSAGIGISAYLRSRNTSPDYSKFKTDQLRNITSHAPTPEAFLVLFQRVYGTNDKFEALKVARDMVHRYPADARAHNILGIAYAANDDPVSAKKAFHNAISLDPHRVDPYVNIGRLDLLVDDNQQAAIDFDLATVVDPKSASAWTGLGEAHGRLHNSSEATDALNKAIQLAPNRPNAYADLGVYLAEMGNSDQARPNLKRALDLGYHSASLYTGLAMAYADQPHSQEELTQALDYADKAEQMGDHSGLLYYARGLAQQRLSRYDEAVASFRKVIAVSENANGAWTGISQCYRALGKTLLADEAAKTAERVLTQRQHISNLKHEIRLSPNRLDLRVQYGDALSANGQYLLAADQYRYAAVHSPEKPSLWLKTAHAFELGGEKDLANYVRQFAYQKPAKMTDPPADKALATGKQD